MTASVDGAPDDSRSRFIVQNTKLLAPPLVPEIVLHLAEESVPIWQKTEEELGQMNVPPPYWAFAWAGGQAVARYLLDRPQICRDKRVLDLGAGSGLATIIAAKTDARQRLAVDIDVYANAACLLNAKANGVAIEVSSEDLLDARDRGFDVVIVGDLFYERELANRVLGFIDEARHRGAEVLIGDPQRSYFPRDRFECVSQYKVPVTRELEDADIKNTAVWRA